MTFEKCTDGQPLDPSRVPMPSQRKCRVKSRLQPVGAKSGEILEGPEDCKLLEAQETADLPAREAAQTPDVETIRQSSPIVLPQSVDISEHVDDRCGDNSFDRHLGSS